MMKRSFSFRALLLITVAALVVQFSACKNRISSDRPFRVVHADWIEQATLYEVNLRQYTKEGTFRAFLKHLPRLKKLGVDILWFMPIHPIGKVNRKGTLGSYYSVKDYYAINPEFGTLDDFRAVVDSAHSLGMKVIIDIVANHTSHDAVLLHEHPDWYVRDSVGKVVSPFDWSDVAKLDYSKPELREYMISMLEYWVRDIGLDGFRCDVAAEVPTDFWNQARERLNRIKPIFMLAEAEQPDLQEYAFDADYAWELHHIMNEIAAGKKNASDIDSYLERKAKRYPKNTINLLFITNHDENSWNGTEFERMGRAVKPMAALTFLLKGMPLIYSGQEVGFNRRLEFFEKDRINWDDSLNFTRFYKALVALKKNHAALAAGPQGGEFLRINTSADSAVFAFSRVLENDTVWAVFNLSSVSQRFMFTGNHPSADFTSYFSDRKFALPINDTITFEPWEFRVFVPVNKN